MIPVISESWRFSLLRSTLLLSKFASCPSLPATVLAASVLSPLFLLKSDTTSLSIPSVKVRISNGSNKSTYKLLMLTPIFVTLVRRRPKNLNKMQCRKHASFVSQVATPTLAISRVRALFTNRLFFHLVYCIMYHPGYRSSIPVTS